MPASTCDLPRRWGTRRDRGAAEQCVPVTERESAGSVRRDMSIERESTGLPEVDTRRATTKVNLAIIAAVTLFLLGMTGLVLWLSNR